MFNSIINGDSNSDFILDVAKFLSWVRNKDSRWESVVSSIKTAYEAQISLFQDRKFYIDADIIYSVSTVFRDVGKSLIEDNVEYIKNILQHILDDFSEDELNRDILLSCRISQMRTENYLDGSSVDIRSEVANLKESGNSFLSLVLSKILLEYYISNYSQEWDQDLVDYLIDLLSGTTSEESYYASVF